LPNVVHHPGLGHLPLREYLLPWLIVHLGDLHFGPQ
jgi:hypothetical protein